MADNSSIPLKYQVIILYVTGSGERAHLAQVINFQFIALSERVHSVLSNAL